MDKLNLEELRMVLGTVRRKIMGCNKRMTNVGFAYDRVEQTDARRSLPKWVMVKDKIIAMITEEEKDAKE